MKEFLKTYLGCLFVTGAFLFFGGWQLFDFNRHFFLATASAAFVLAVVLSAWLDQEDRIEKLTLRVEELENKEKEQ